MAARYLTRDLDDRLVQNAPSAEATILLVKSHHLGWGDIRAVLRRDGRVRIVAELSRSLEAVRRAELMRPDGIVMAADLSDMPVTTLVRELLAASPESKIIAIGDEPDQETLCLLAQLGTYGFLPWEGMTPRRLQCAVEAVLQAGLWVGSRKVIGALVEAPRSDWDGPPLTPLERGVLGLRAQGLKETEIAETEHVSLRTVQRTIRAVERRLGARNQYELAKRVTELGLDQEPDGNPPRG